MGQAHGRLADYLGRHGRGATLAAVIGLAAAGWVFLIAAIAGGGAPAGFGLGMAPLAPLLERVVALWPWLAAGGAHGPLMPAMSPWGIGDVLLVLAMWAAMVFAMMLPTAAATFRAYAIHGGAVSLAVMAGYAGVWLGFAAIGTAVQTALTYAGALMPHMAPAGTALSASILLSAGLYQFTPLKLACLVRCRNPYPTELEAPSVRTALAVGFEEGTACLGCCWAMMAVMFAAGLMNVVAMAFLGAMMGYEKLTRGLVFTYFVGVVLLLMGVILAGGLFFG